MKRIPILYLAFGVLFLVSVPPLLFYGTKLISINREALETNEQELQNTIARSMASEITLYDSSHREWIKTFTKTLEDIDFTKPTWGDPKIQDTLEQFVGADPSLLYVTLLNAQGKGLKSGTYNADADPFLLKVLERAFVASQQNQQYFSQPVLVSRSGERLPVSVLSIPLHAKGSLGMLAVVLDLSSVREHLRNVSLRGLEVYVVDHSGILMLHPNLDNNPIGIDLKDRRIVQKFLSWQGAALAAETTTFDMDVLVDGKKQSVAMLGTYCSIPALQWAVIAQKKQADAYFSVREMQLTTTLWGMGWLVVCLAVAYVAATAVARPITYLTESSAAIARGDFSRRIHIRNRTEIGELAATFNTMTAELERYVGELKAAVRANHELFLASIRMIAAAVDEKDPYTHGHAERVTRYSTLIATEMGLPDDEVYKVKISAVLHDVGKIGIEDRILKKPGALTPEEYEIMKTHTVKGANIVRAVSQLHDMIPGIELHHESVDGAGYPHHLKGDDIPLMARIISVADTFDAMTTHRPYQTAMDPAVVVKFIQSQAGRKFDPACAAALQRAHDTGKLKLQRVAAVT